jgi:hypothetical protein
LNFSNMVFPNGLLGYCKNKIRDKVLKYCNSEQDFHFHVTTSKGLHV